MYDCIRLCVLCMPEQQGCCRGRVSSPLMGCLERAVATLEGGETKTTIQNNIKQNNGTDLWLLFKVYRAVCPVCSVRQRLQRGGEWQSEGLASPREKGSAYCKQRDVRADLH